MSRKSGRVRAGLSRSVRAEPGAGSCSLSGGATRRSFLIAVAAWPALAWTGAALAQAAQTPVLIGLLDARSREASGKLHHAAFREGLAALGLKEGSQVVIEERRLDRLPALAAELAAKRAAVIVGVSGPAAAAATKAAPRTPIVVIGGNPVVAGLAASLARPGGMVTGIASLTSDVSEKYVELLLAAVPKVRRIGFLFDTTPASHAIFVANVRRSLSQYSVESRFAEVARVGEIGLALSRLAKEGAQALVVMPSPGVLATGRRRIVKFALEQRWPMISSTREWAEAGALLSYGVDVSASYRRAAYYVDRILKGAKPADMPIEQPTKTELVINLKTAKAIGLTIPQGLLFRADKVIE